MLKSILAMDTTSPIKPAVSPRFARKQTSFDETRERFEKERLKNEVKPTKTTVPGKLPTNLVFNRSTSNTGSGSPAKLDVVPQRASSKTDYQSDTRKTSPKETSFSRNAVYNTSPSTRRRDPGRITDFVPEVDRETSEYKLTLAQGRQSPGRILDFVPENERSKSHRPVYTSQGVDELGKSEYSHKSFASQHVVAFRFCLESRASYHRRRRRIELSATSSTGC